MNERPATHADSPLHREAAAGYARVRAAKVLKDYRVIVYRCERRCAMIDVLAFPAPIGRVFVEGSASYSNELNPSDPATPSQNNSTDARHWRRHLLLDDEVLGLSPRCGHHPPNLPTVPKSRIEQDIAEGLREVILTKDDLRRMADESLAARRNAKRRQSSDTP